MFTYSENGHLIRKNPENLIKILPCLKYLFLDRSEAEFVSGQASPAASARYLQRGGVPNVIITEGSRGSHLFLGENYFKIPAFPPRRVADPTGAGDTYLAAFVRSLELFSDPQSQGKFAAMVATMSLEDKGAFQKSLTEVLARL
jgi:sugar/nucleoside kinase (ribokinase family)